jgi:hypothetical protein
MLLRADSRSSSHITSGIRGSQISGMNSPVVRALRPPVGLVGWSGTEGWRGGQWMKRRMGSVTKRREGLACKVGKSARGQVKRRS